MEIDRNGLEVLTRDECLDLLDAGRHGRIGVTMGALPNVLPVTYRFLDEHIVIRTGAGTKLDAATRNAVVAFEIDDFAGESRSGWSVMVTGVAREVVDPDELDRLSRHDLDRWAPLGNGRIIAISTELVSGRRIRPEI